MCLCGKLYFCGFLLPIHDLLQLLIIRSQSQSTPDLQVNSSDPFLLKNCFFF